MEHCNIVLWFLVPPDEKSAEPIHPTVSTLHYPTTRLGARAASLRLHLLATRADITRETKLLDKRTHFIIVIALVHTHTLWLLRCWLRPFDRNAGQCLFDHLHVVAVGAVHRDADGNTRSFDQDAPLDSAFGAIGGVFPRLFPPRGEPWSCSRPYSATANQCLSDSHTPKGRPSTSRRKLRP